MVGFRKSSPVKKQKKEKEKKSKPEKGLKEDNKIKESKKKKRPTKEKKSRFSKKKDREVENLTQEELLGVKEEKKPSSSVKCFCHLRGQKIENEESVGDPAYTKWFMGELKKENLPPIDATVSQARYTTELGKEIRIAVESISDDIPEDIIEEDSSMNIEPKQTKKGKRKVEVNIL